MTTPAPPPARKKEKPINSVKVIQAEQSQKLQQKHGLEQELLEDIRAYSKLRANVEREYAQGLQKIVSQFMQKFAPKTLDVEEAKTPFGIWRRMLEETEEISKSRLVIAQSLMDTVAEDIKALRAARAQTVKKCTALTESLHQEMQVSVQEMSDCQKTYADNRKLFIQTAEQATEAREKLKKGGGKFFQSKSKMEKNATKLEEKRELTQKKSLVSRNEYLLSLSSANAHQQRYYSTDLPELIVMQDGNIYEKFKDYFSEIAKVEIDNCGKHLNVFTKLLDNISQLQRTFAIQFFLKQNPVFTQCAPFDFQPFRDNEPRLLSDKLGAGLHLNKEARKWATRLTREQRLIEKKTREWRALLPQQNLLDEGIDADTLSTSQAISDVLEEIRHLEVLKCKAEARLNLLKAAGVNVDEWLTSASQEQEAEENEGDVTNLDYEEDLLDDDWDEDGGFLSPEQDEDSTSQSSSYSHPLQRVVALYAFQAAGDEELSITENEELELIERDVDGWVKGRNSLGQVGFFPESYIEPVRTSSIVRAASDEHVLGSHNSSSQDLFESERRSSNSSDRNAADTSSRTIPEYICLVRALYDYTASEAEELTFKEGDIIMVTDKNEDMDDGWWEGVLNQRKGTFPNIVVEEIRMDSETGPREWPLCEGRRSLVDSTYASLPRVRKKDER